MKKFKLTLIAGVLASMSGAALATSNDVVDTDMSRRAAGSTSGSGHTVVGNCGDDGYAWQGATAELEIKQKGTGSKVGIGVEGAIPNTLFTVWLRVQGGDGWNRDVNGNKGSPLTGGGATPLASGTELDGLNAISPWVDAAGASYSANSFTTDADGNGEFKADLDFAVVGGAYPFYAATTERPGYELVPKVGYAIPTPATSPGTPFLLRVISHCTDNASHGLSPATREAWFQYP